MNPQDNYLYHYEHWAVSLIFKTDFFGKYVETLILNLVESKIISLINNKLLCFAPITELVLTQFLLEIILINLRTIILVILWIRICLKITFLNSLFYLQKFWIKALLILLLFFFFNTVITSFLSFFLKKAFFLRFFLYLKFFKSLNRWR